MNYLPFDLDAALEDQRRGKPCRIVNTVTGKSAIAWHYWGDVEPNYPVSIYWDKDNSHDYTIDGKYHVEDSKPSVGLMPERVERSLAYDIINEHLFVQRELCNLHGSVQYKLTMNPDGSDPQIEIVK